MMPKENYLLEAIQNFPYEHTPEEHKEYEKVLRSKQEVKEGGRVPLGEGGDPGTSSAEEVREAWKDILKEKENGTSKGSWKEWQPIWIRAKLAQGGRVSLSSGGLAGMLGE